MKNYPFLDLCFGFLVPLPRISVLFLQILPEIIQIERKIDIYIDSYKLRSQYIYILFNKAGGTLFCA